jgi:hypothetical protein
MLEVRDRHHSYVIPLLLPWAGLALARLWSLLEARLADGRREHPDAPGAPVEPAPGPGDAIH